MSARRRRKPATTSFFAEVEKKRGNVVADKLRDDCRTEWAKVIGAGKGRKK